MNSGKFLDLLTNTYRNLLFEQDIPAPQAPLAPPEAPMGAVPPPMPPAAPMGQPSDTAASVEKDKQGNTALKQEGQTNLANMLAKAFFIEVTDSAERYQIENMQNSLDDESKLADIEFELVKKIETLDTQILDVEDSLFELTPEGANMFIDAITKRGLIPGLEVKPGGGKAYMLNLVITALLRPANFNVVDIENLLEEIKKKTQPDTVSESKFGPLYNSALSKYAKI